MKLMQSSHSKYISKVLYFLAVVIFLLTFFMIGGCGAGVEKCLEEGSCGPAVDVKNVAGVIPLNPEAAFWSAADAPVKVNVELGPQMITNPKWPDPSIKSVNISAARNKDTLAIHLEWQDDSVDHRYGPSANYTDQAAVMFPLSGNSIPPISMGVSDEPVNVWQWRAMWEINPTSAKEEGKHARSGFDSGIPAVTFEKRDSPVEDLNAEGFSTLTTQDEQNVSGKGLWKNNMWKVVYKRSLTSPDNGDVQFKHSVPMAVAIWNGGNRERNGQKGIAGWLLLRLS